VATELWSGESLSWREIRAARQKRRVHPRIESAEPYSLAFPHGQSVFSGGTPRSALRSDAVARFRPPALRSRSLDWRPPHKSQERPDRLDLIMIVLPDLIPPLQPMLHTFTGPQKQHRQRVSRIGEIAEA
jgi:hypothetical protein